MLPAPAFCNITWSTWLLNACPGSTSADSHRATMPAECCGMCALATLQQTTIEPPCPRNAAECVRWHHFRYIPPPLPAACSSSNTNLKAILAVAKTMVPKQGPLKPAFPENRQHKPTVGHASANSYNRRAGIRGKLGLEWGPN